MTPVMQLTDTHVAAYMKRASDEKKREILREKRDQAEARHEKFADTTCSKLDMLRVCLAGHEQIEKLNGEKKMLLSGLRQTGWLRWKPDLKSGRLVRVDEVYPEMKKEMPERSHRIPESWWGMRDAGGYEGRGKPEAPSVKELGRWVKSEADLMDEFPAQAPDEKIKLDAWDEYKKCHEGAPEVEIDLEGVADDEMKELRPAAMRMAMKAVEEARLEKYLTDPEKPMMIGDAKSAGKMMRKKKLSKIKARCKRRLVRKLRAEDIRDWRAEAVSYMGRYSRSQLMRALVPEAQPKSNKRVTKRAEDTNG